MLRVVTNKSLSNFLSSKETRTKSALVQRYVDKPYLIKGKKFDLRIYCLVTGVDPLRVYIHEEGLTRFSTADYSLKNTKNRFAHLTNYSVNKKSSQFAAATMDSGGDSDMEGAKWSLSAFRRYLATHESEDIMKRTMMRVHDVVLKTMIAAEAEITPRMHAAANFRTNCFELFGLDILLDRELRPHLVEVNISPSLVGSSPLDRKIKGILIADILHVRRHDHHYHALDCCDSDFCYCCDDMLCVMLRICFRLWVCILTILPS